MQALLRERFCLPVETSVNQLLLCSDSMMETLMKNIETVLADDNTSELDTMGGLLHKKQMELIKLAQLRKDYSDVEDEIDKLKQKQQTLLRKKAEDERLKQRIDEIETFIKESNHEYTEYDEKLVRKYIQEIKVYDDHLQVCFKAGIELHIDR